MSLIFNVLRSTDLLNLQFEFLNLRIDETGSRPVLKRVTPGAAHIVVRLPPQHMSEQAVSTGALEVPFNAVLSGPSRLAFELPDGVEEIALTLQDLLGLVTELAPIVPDAPLSTGASTVIEFPYHLLLIPGDKVRLRHRKEPPSTNKIWNELWQTGLHDEAKGVRLRAIPYPNDQEALSSATLGYQDRLDIAKRSSIEPFGHHIIEADRFLLSTLGASVKLRSTWTTAITETTLSDWSHEASLGRDHLVRRVREGFLFPFKHRAAIETITRRTLSGGSVLVAELKQDPIIGLREWDRTYQGRDMPLKRIQLTSVPALTLRGSEEPELGPYRVDASVFDLAGNAVNCSLNVLFVPLHDARDTDTLELIKAKYLALPPPPDVPLNVANLNMQRMILAETPDSRGGTDFNVSTIIFDVKLLRVDEAGPADPLFEPIMGSAEVCIPAVEQLKGAVRRERLGTGRPVIPIRLTEDYVNRGIDLSDTKQVFAEIIEPIKELEIPASKAGGLARPKFPDMNGLSRLLGPVSDVRNFVGADPPDAEALIGQTKLLGTIMLKDLVDLSEASDLGFLTQQPEALFDKVVDDTNFVLRRPVIATVRTGAEVETRFVWKPKIKDILPGDLLRQRDPPQHDDPERPEGKMQLIIRGRMKLAPTAMQTDLLVEGRLTNFVLSLAGLVSVEFNKVEFISNAGRKMEVKTSIAKIGFQGDLAFAEEIRKAIPIKGLGDASISPRPDGIVASYSLGLPAVGLGVLTLQQLAFNASVALPFDENPVAIRFALSERRNPFLVSVAPFGGTGFFALEMRTGGPCPLLVEAAIEFGGVIAFNLLNIVKGGVYVFAGIYLAIRSGPPVDISISAHLRVGGFVDVLGLISVSIEFYLALEFRSADDKLAGTAMLTIGVKVLFFSKTFTFSVHKEIAHLGAIPRHRRADFRILTDETQWAKYCRAFA